MNWTQAKDKLLVWGGGFVSGILCGMGVLVLAHDKEIALHQKAIESVEEQVKMNAIDLTRNSKRDDEQDYEIVRVWATISRSESGTEKKRASNNTTE